MKTVAQQSGNGEAKDVEKPNVLISGASFAGLATAYWMHRLGYVVTLVEIAKDLKKGGTPVNIRDGVIDVVRRMGMFQAIIENSLPDRPMEFLDGLGNPATNQVAAIWDGEDGSVQQYEVERDFLLELLFQKIQDNVEVLFADSISSLEESADEVTVTLSSGRRQSFSLVIGCDGTHSAVRKMCFGKESSFSLFMQNYFSLTIVDRLLIEEDTQQMFQVPGRTVMLNAYNNKTDIAFCFFSEQEIVYDRRDQVQHKNIILDHFQGEGWRIPELLEEMTRCDDFYFDKFCQIRMGSWTKGRIALVGDAAYCPSPAAGMGGSMAILGAAALADALQQYPDDLSRAFQEYDESFRPTAEAIQAGAIEFGLEMVMPGTKESMRRRDLEPK